MGMARWRGHAPSCKSIKGRPPAGGVYTVGVMRIAATRRLVVAGMLAIAGLLAVYTTAFSGGSRSSADPADPAAARTPGGTSHAAERADRRPVTRGGTATAHTASGAPASAMPSAPEPNGRASPTITIAATPADPPTPADPAPVDGTTDPTASMPADTAQTVAELPGGGTVMFPGRTLVALYGHPGAPSLGALGEQSVGASIAQVTELAASYRGRVSGTVVPTFEIIATVATRVPGADGTYSTTWPASKLRPWVDAATAHGMYVIIDLQPGRASFLSQANAYVDLLRQPNVGLAIDPEWKLEPRQRPLQGIGGVDAAEVNGVISWLSRLTAANHLPQKVLVLHQFTPSMLRDEDRIVTDDENVTVLIHMDGQGSQAGKNAAWASVVRAAPPGVYFGWKNFFTWDTPMLDPAKTMALNPVPLMVSYQ